MKKIIVLFVAVFCFSNIYAQNCEKISPYKKGMKLEYTNYNKRGKAKAVDNLEVLSVDNSKGALRISIRQTTKKEDPITYDLKCKNGNFYIDLNSYLGKHGGSNDFNIGAEGSFLVFPDNVKSGDSLEDGEIELKAGGSDGLSLFTMQVLNRKVIERGEIKTKAKVFKDGYKVTFDYVFNLSIIKIRGKGEEWYVNGVGIVKSMDYNKKGKLRSTRELTKITE